MNTIIRSALINRLQQERDYRSSSKPRLWASEAGGCARKAMLRIQGFQPTREFPIEAKEAMQNGVMFEADTEDALRLTYNGRLSTQVYLVNDQWSCKADFILDIGSAHPTIIEHKAQGEKWWNFQGSIPKHEHLVQILLYRHLYQEKYGVTPKLILFYRSWGHYAELEITTFDDYVDGVMRVQALGEMDGEPYHKVVALDPEQLRHHLEHLYTENILPERFPTKQEGLCTFKGRPSCPMYGHCWSD